MHLTTDPAGAPEHRGPSPRARRMIFRFMVTMAAGYAWEAVLLFAFAFAGYVPFGLAAAFSSIFLGGWLLLGLAFRTGWNLRCRDPLLFMPQFLFSVVLSTAMLIAMPQISIQPLSIMSVIFVHGFMAPDRKNLVVAWTLVAVGVIVMIAVAGPSLAMPSATPAGRALILLVMLGCLIRCMGFTTYVRELQRGIREKNAALKEALARNEQLASRDELTGVANRRSVLRSAEEQKAQFERNGTAFCIALMDIDFFKHINDAHGHPVGDQALVALTQRIGETMRTSDQFGRYGGEEFLAIFVATPLAEARVSLERIRSAVEAHDWSAIAPGLALTVTCGVTQYRAGDSVDAAIRRADDALYVGKAAGRNRVVVSEA